MNDNAPTDMNDREITIGCTIFLKHNGRFRKVTHLERLENGVWIVGCDAGGAFLLPQSKNNVTVVD